MKRVYSGASGGTVGYLRMGYAGGQVAFETDSAAAGAPTVIYTWGPGVDQLVGVRVGGTDYGVITDPLGSVRALVRRSDGSWAGRLSYAPYGELLDSAGPQPALRYRWTGREWDAETGFYFHRTRYYDPGVGRFVQEDRAGYAGGGNLYAYVNGDVLQARDPQGLLPTEDRYRLPDYCCGIWNSQWDGWFGITGSLFESLVHFGTFLYHGATFRCIVELDCPDELVYQAYLYAFERYVEKELGSLTPLPLGGTKYTSADAVRRAIAIDSASFMSLLGEFGSRGDKLSAAVRGQLVSGQLLRNDLFVANMNLDLGQSASAYTFNETTVLAAAAFGDVVWAVAHEQFHRKSLWNWPQTAEARINFEVRRALFRCPRFPRSNPVVGQEECR